MLTKPRFDRNIIRVGIFLLFTGLFVAQSLGVIPIYGGLDAWDITSGFNFRPSNSFGLVRFNTDTSATAWAFSGEFVTFSSISVGGGLSYSSLGYSCSSNADMNVTSLALGTMEYIVSAVGGQVSTTKIQFPSKATVESVDNSDSFSYDSDTRVLTVLKTHGGSETITVNFIRGGSGIDNFEAVRSTWMAVFLLAVLVGGFGIANQVMRGEVQVTGFWGLIMLAMFTAVFMMLLSITASLWP